VENRHGSYRKEIESFHTSFFFLVVKNVPGLTPQSFMIVRGMTAYMLGFLPPLVKEDHNLALILLKLHTYFIRDRVPAK
jgi:hypothetical protein